MSTRAIFLRLQDVERFWSKVSRSDEGCWEWRGAKSRGYGQIEISVGPGRRDRINCKAHRLSWLLSFGPIPEGYSVLHSCDNPSCVRPDHLFVGTQKDNIHDCCAKGRNARGERHGRFGKGVPLSVRNAIKASEGSYRSIGRQFGLHPETISRIKKEKPSISDLPRDPWFTEGPPN